MAKGVSRDLIQEVRSNSRVMNGFRMLPYLNVANPDTLIIGPGGGMDLIAARIRGAKSITAVDINPVTVYAMKHVFRDFNGNLYNQPSNKVYVAEGRSFVARSNHRYTNIHMNGVDTLNALAAGANVTAENYLYTTEAMVDYLNHLRDDGFLSIVRHSFEVPRESIKLCTAMIDAMIRLNLGDASSHIMLIGGPPPEDWTTFLVKKSPLTAEDVAHLQPAIDAHKLRVFYKPGMQETDDIPADSQRARYFIRLFEANKQGKLAEFMESYPYDIHPATDDRPYFFKIQKARAYLHPMETVTPYEKNFGLIAIIILCLQTLLVSLVLIVAPLAHFHREGLRVPHRTRYLLYFAGLGLAFMLIELSLMQKLSLMLGHPTYAIGTVLSSILIFCGIGSLVSGTLRLTPRSLIAIAAAGITLLVMLAMWLLPAITTATLGWPLWQRALTAAVLLAPLAFCMGIPFPTGLRLLSDVNLRFIPWAWGANGVASVIGSVVCILLSMAYGFNVVLGVGIGAYLIAALCMLTAVPAIEHQNAASPVVHQPSMHGGDRRAS